MDNLRLNLLNASEIQEVPSSPDANAQNEELSYSGARKQVLLDGLRQNIHERKKYAGRIFWLAVGWTCSVIVILIFNGFGRCAGRFHFHLDNPVLLAAIGSTTTNILGLLYVVVRYLFPDTSQSSPAGQN